MSTKENIYLPKWLCETKISFKNVILIKENDIKQKEPLKIKRKYGNFDREIIKIPLNGKA